MNIISYRLKAGDYSIWPSNRLALSFVGASSKEHIKRRARELIAKHGDRWQAEWLRERGLPEAAEELDKERPTVPQTAPLVAQLPFHAGGSRPSTSALKYLREGRGVNGFSNGAINRELAD